MCEILWTFGYNKCSDKKSTNVVLGPKAKILLVCSVLNSKIIRSLDSVVNPVVGEGGNGEGRGENGQNRGGRREKLLEGRKENKQNKEKQECWIFETGQFQCYKKN